MDFSKFTQSHPPVHTLGIGCRPGCMLSRLLLMIELWCHVKHHNLTGKKKQVGKWTQIPSRTQIKFHVVCPPESTCYTTYTYTFAIGLALQTLWESPTFPANHVSHFLRFSPWYIYICIYIDIYIYIEMLLFNLFGAWTCCFYLFYTPGAVRLTFWGPGSTNPDRVVWRIEVL